MSIDFSKLRAETGKLSDVERMRKQPEYRRLLKLGNAIVGDLIAALSDDRQPIVAILALLRDLTGEGPAKIEGNIENARRFWLNEVTQ